MNTSKKKFLWLTDTHFNLSWKFSMIRLIRKLNAEKANGLFLTGDISDGKNIEKHLTFLAKHINCNIYFILGNHDYHHRSIKSVHKEIKKLCKQYNNLYWMTRSGVISLSHDVALIGVEGWYDAKFGDKNWLKWTLDRHLIKEFNRVDFDSQLMLFKMIARKSSKIIIKNLKKAIKNHKTVYIITHIPPWKEATRAEGTFMEPFWLPYNTNYILGKAIEKVMKHKKKRKVIVLAGHTHHDCYINVSRNIECRVNKASYCGPPKHREKIII